jgi:hypothetical protein
VYSLVKDLDAFAELVAVDPSHLQSGFLSFSTAAGGGWIKPEEMSLISRTRERGVGERD